jgi:hypothetical protein
MSSVLESLKQELLDINDLDLENSWIFTIVTVTIWILIATVIEVVFTNGSLQSGIIYGFAGGLAYSITYKTIQKFSK